MAGYDATDVRDLTRGEIEGRRQALLAIEALRRFAPGSSSARLRNFGMTLGTRDSRKIVGRYDLTGRDVRGEARFADSIGIFPEFIDGYGVLVLPTTGRYFQVPYGALVPGASRTCWSPGAAWRATGRARATRSQMCCAVTGQAAGVAAAVSLPTARRARSRWPCAVRARRQGVRLARASARVSGRPRRRPNMSAEPAFHRHFSDGGPPQNSSNDVRWSGPRRLIKWSILDSVKQACMVSIIDRGRRPVLSPRLRSASAALPGGVRHGRQEYEGNMASTS